MRLLSDCSCGQSGDRVDHSEVHAFDARRAFLLNISQGESALSVAEAALQIAAEDDAIVSHSTVRLPIQASAALPMLSVLNACVVPAN